MSMLKSLLLAGVIVFGIAAVPFAGAQDGDHANETQHDDTKEHSDDADGHGNPNAEGAGDTGHGELEHGDAGHGEESLPPILSFDPGAAVANLVIFLCVFAILAKLAWPSVLNILTVREEKIRSDLQAAEQARVKAQETLAEYEQKVAVASQEAQAILAEARQDAQANATKIVDEAKAEAARQGERAIADIETAKKVALTEIAEQTSAVAMSVAKQVVGRELKSDDHADLIRNALDQMPSNN